MGEWTTLIRTAMSVLVILLAISVVVFLTYLGMNSANRSGEKLAVTLTAMEARAFDQYNQTTVSGTAVLSAINNFQHQSMAVIVQTLKNDGTDLANYCASLGEEPRSGGEWFEYRAGRLDAVGNPPEVELLVTEDFLDESAQNVNLQRAITESSTWYVNPTAKFKSCLIKDVNDEIVGVYFEQQLSANGGQSYAEFKLQGTPN